MANDRRFNARRAPVGQVKARVESTSRFIVSKMAGGNIGRVNLGMVQTAAAKNGLNANELAARLRQLGANI